MKLTGSKVDHSTWESGWWSLLPKSLSFILFLYVPVLTLTELQQVSLNSGP